jgi:hypothetical protein
MGFIDRLRRWVAQKSFQIHRLGLNVRGTYEAKV